MNMCPSAETHEQSTNKEYAWGGLYVLFVDTAWTRRGQGVDNTQDVYDRVMATTHTNKLLRTCGQPYSPGMRAAFIAA